MEHHLNIDHWIDEQKQFWHDLEVHCVAGCCGIDAFNLEKEHIQKTIKNYDEKLIQDYLLTLVERLIYVREEFIYSNTLNHYEDKLDFTHTIIKIVKITI